MVCGMFAVDKELIYGVSVNFEHVKMNSIFVFQISDDLYICIIFDSIYAIRNG